jgi:hypothetical protein
MAEDEDDGAPPKVSSSFRQGKKKRKKGVSIGYIEKKPRQKKNKKAPSPLPEEAMASSDNECPVLPAVLAPEKPSNRMNAVRASALFVPPPSLSVSPPAIPGKRVIQWPVRPWNYINLAIRKLRIACLPMICECVRGAGAQTGLRSEFYLSNFL